jgi:hypothetical protein
MPNRKDVLERLIVDVFDNLPLPTKRPSKNNFAVFSPWVNGVIPQFHRGQTSCRTMESFFSSASELHPGGVVAW